MSEKIQAELEAKLRILATHAWDGEVFWSDIAAWIENFDGRAFDAAEEKLYGLIALSQFMYFGKRLSREMLKALYRDYFRSPLCQRIRRNNGGTTDTDLIAKFYEAELSATRFVGVGNPAESGAHLLYYFRQVNRLSKDLFVDFSSAFRPESANRTSRSIIYMPTNPSVTRYVFFDDLVGSGTQVSLYLSKLLRGIRASGCNYDLRFMSLFATSKGLRLLNSKHLFDGRAMCLFELDDSYRAFDDQSRYFRKPPSWFDKNKLLQMATYYGERLRADMPLGYKDGQLLIGFSHNTPDNVPPIFWDEGITVPWHPVFTRYDKIYGQVT